MTGYSAKNMSDLNVNQINSNCRRKKTGKCARRDIEARSCSHHCSGTYSEFASAALGTQHTMRMRHIAICGLPCTTTFLHII